MRPTLEVTDRALLKAKPPEKALAYIAKKYGGRYKEFIDKALSAGFEPEKIVDLFLKKSQTKATPIEKFVATPILNLPAGFMKSVREGTKAIQIGSPLQKGLGVLQILGAPFSAIGEATKETTAEILKSLGTKPEEAYKVGSIAGFAGELVIPAGVAYAPIRGVGRLGKAIKGIREVKVPTIKEGASLREAITEFKKLPEYQNFLEIRKAFPEIDRLEAKVKKKILRKFGLSYDTYYTASVIHSIENLSLKDPKIFEKVEALRKPILEKLSLLETKARPKMRQIRHELNALRAKELSEFRDFLIKNKDIIGKPEELEKAFIQFRARLKEIGTDWENLFERHPELKPVLFSDKEATDLITLLVQVLPQESFLTFRLIEGIKGATLGKPLEPKYSKILSFVLGKDIVNYINAYANAVRQTPFLRLIGRAFAEVNFGIKQIIASMDLSALFRQAYGFTGRKEFWQNIPTAIRPYFSKDYYHFLMESMFKHPEFKTALNAGVQFTIEGLSKEELYMARYVTKIPFFGRFLEASEQAFTGFLNKLRFDIFLDGLKRLRQAKLEGAELERELRRLADYINIMTGRGTWRFLDKYGPDLAHIFWAPRLYASRIQMLNPLTYINLHPALRRRALLDVASFVTFSTSLLALGKFGLNAFGIPAEVELDPRNADFLKLKIEDLRIEPWGGLTPYVTLISRLLTGEYISSLSGEKIKVGIEGETPLGKPTRLDFVLRFFRQKVTPFLDQILDLTKIYPLEFHERENWQRAVLLFTPIFFQDVFDLIEDIYKDTVPLPVGITKTVLGTLSSLVGFGVNKYYANDEFNKYFTDLSKKREVDKELVKHKILLPKDFKYTYAQKFELPVDGDLEERFLKCYALTFYPLAYKIISSKEYKDLDPTDQQRLLKNLSNKIRMELKDLFFIGNVKYQKKVMNFYNLLYKEMTNYIYKRRDVFMPEEKDDIKALRRAEEMAKDAVEKFFIMKREETRRLLSVLEYKRAYEELIKEKPSKPEEAKVFAGKIGKALKDVVESIEREEGLKREPQMNILEWTLSDETLGL